MVDEAGGARVVVWDRAKAMQRRVSPSALAIPLRRQLSDLSALTPAVGLIFTPRALLCSPGDPRSLDTKEPVFQVRFACIYMAESL